mmetsp:Transcript_106085/g.306911  ORF Transcript_106085/g.306911 Transcript_106085/m.306911 type:complete len:425 (+) Transcript_106085:486-1760(+)
MHVAHVANQREDADYVQDQDPGEDGHRLGTTEVGHGRREKQRDRANSHEPAGGVPDVVAAHVIARIGLAPRDRETVREKDRQHELRRGVRYEREPARHQTAHHVHDGPPPKLGGVRAEVEGEYVELRPAQPRLAPLDLLAAQPEQQERGQRHADRERDAHDEGEAAGRLIALALVVAAQGHIDEHELVNTALTVLELLAGKGLGDDHARGRQRVEDEEKHELHLHPVPDAAPIEVLGEPVDEHRGDDGDREQRGGEELGRVVPPARHTIDAEDRERVEVDYLHPTDDSGEGLGEGLTAVEQDDGLVVGDELSMHDENRHVVRKGHNPLLFLNPPIAHPPVHVHRAGQYDHHHEHEHGDDGKDHHAGALGVLCRLLAVARHTDLLYPIHIVIGAAARAEGSCEPDAAELVALKSHMLHVIAVWIR